MYAVKVSSDNNLEIARFPENSNDELPFLQAAVGGWIERVQIMGNSMALDMYVNEEGLLNGLPYNPFASYMYRAATGMDTVIVGDVVIVAGNDLGDCLPLSEGQKNAVLSEFMEFVTMYDHGCSIIDTVNSVTK